jgi:hypothetical protein
MAAIDYSDTGGTDGMLGAVWVGVEVPESGGEFTRFWIRESAPSASCNAAAKAEPSYGVVSVAASVALRCSTTIAVIPETRAATNVFTTGPTAGVLTRGF